MSQSRQHKAAFYVAIQAAKTQAELDKAIKAHVGFMTPADTVEARRDLAKRAAEISPNRPVKAS